MNLIKRSGIAASITVGAALVAVGCGGGSGGGSNATSAAKDAAALDLVPEDAIGYVTVDTDLEGDGWKQFDDLARAFKDDYEGTAKELKDEDSDYEQDVKPWIGDSAGAALLSVDSSGEDAEFFGWVDVSDRDEFESFLKKEDYTKAADIGDYATWTSEDGEDVVASSDDLALIADDRAVLEARIEFDGDSIKGVDGLGDVIDEAGDEALVTAVVSGPGLVKLVEDLPQGRQLGDVKQLEDFDGLAVTFAAEDEGLRVHGYAAGEGEEAGTNTTHDVFTDLPGTTLFALGGRDLGGGLEQVADGAGESDPQVQQAIGAASGALGVDVDDLAEAFSGEFAFAVGADDDGLGALAGSAMGAAMGGGLAGTDLGTLAEAATITLAFEEEGEASDTLDKVVGAVGGLAGATGAPTEATEGDFTTKTIDLGGVPITTAASDEVAAVSVGVDVFSAWGDDTLGENDDFNAAWQAADAPDETAATFWLDFARVAELADMQGADDITARGWVGWVEADGSNASFDLFMHVDEE